MARFKQVFRVRAPLQMVWEMHDDPKILPALTPPPLRVKVLAKDDPLRAGSTLKFRLYLIEPLGATWHAIYDAFNPYQPKATQCDFIDRSLSSPFHAWTHHHIFTDNGDGSTTCTDDVTFKLVGGPLGEAITYLFAYLPIVFLFLYRRLKTHMILAQRMRKLDAASTNAN
jgi:ligand-binding SRPBCC domain-containing protein